MRRPNYTVFIYDHVGRFIEKIYVWAVDAQMAINKGHKHIEGQKKDTNFYTFVASLKRC